MVSQPGVYNMGSASYTPQASPALPITAIPMFSPIAKPSFTFYIIHFK